VSDHEHTAEVCLDCELIALIDRYCEHTHLATGKPVDVSEITRVLISRVSEFMAMRDDAKERKHAVKRAQEMLAGMTRQRRATGVYPGGPNAEYGTETAH
jgi:hypothetical protein